MNKESVGRGIGYAMAPIMAVYALGASQGGVNAGMATMAAAFPEAGPNISYVVSLVALGMIPSGIISGAVTGKYVKYKTSILTAIVLYIVAGLAPAFFPDGVSFAALLTCRFIFGLAVGWSFPLAQAIVYKTFQEKGRRAKWLGIGMAFFNIGQIIMEFGGGYLALVSWKACFFVYLIGVPPLILVALMMKEPENDEEQAEEVAATAEGEDKAKIPVVAFLFMLMLALCETAAMPTILYCSFVIGNPAVSGLVLSSMTVVGAVSGFTLGPVFKRIGKWVLPVSALYLGVFFIICGVAAQPDALNLTLYIVAFLVGHWGFAIIIPATSNMVTNLVPIGAATRAMGINVAFQQLGCFLATPFAALLMGILGAQGVTELLLPSAIILLVFAVILLVLTAATKMENYGGAYNK